MWKDLLNPGGSQQSGGQQSGGGGKKPGQRPGPGRNPLLWVLVIGAILIYTQTDGSLFGPTDKTHDSRMAVAPEEVVGEFSLIDHTGTPRTQQDFHGTPTLIYFGFTWCPDVCPSSMLLMAQIVEDLEVQGHSVQPLFITVDPKRDTVEKLADYVAQLPRLVGLTGSDMAVTKALDSFGIYRRSQAEGPGDTDYFVDHASLFYLMGPDGKFIRHFEPSQGPTQIAIEIERHLTG